MKPRQGSPTVPARARLRSRTVSRREGGGVKVHLTRRPALQEHVKSLLFTCGLWLPIWLIVAVAGHSRVRVAGQSSNTPLVIGGVIGALVLLGLVVEHPIALIPLAALAGLGYLGYRAYERRAEQARIAARADTEHQAFMSGDPSAMYGQYPLPYPPPFPPDEQA